MIAQHLIEAASPERDIVIDVFAGAGGNSIAFARSGRWARVIAVERDSKTMQCARHNAGVYEVEEDIEWHEGDCFDYVKALPQDVRRRCVVFASPPWGGVSPDLGAATGRPADGQAPATARPTSLTSTQCSPTR